MLYLYEIDELWPYTSAVGPLVSLLAFWALAMSLLVSAATAVWFTTPLASDLMIWMID